MPLQKEGVILAAEGAGQFISQLGQASKAMSELLAVMTKTQGVSGATSALDSFSKQKDKTTDNAKKSTGVFGQFFKGFGLGAVEAVGLNGTLAALTGGVGAIGTIAGQVAVGGIKSMAQGMANLAKETAPILGIQAQFTSLTAGMAGGMQSMIAALQRGASGMVSNRQLMMSFNQAASLVNLEFAQKMPQALSLLGKVSLATGADMNYLLDSLVRGVGRVSPMILDNLFIQLGVSEATNAASKEFEKEADALSKTEQQTALMNIALEKLEAKFGALPDVAESATGQMGQMSANFQNIKDTLGQFLLPAWTTFLKAVNSLVGGFSEAIAEGGVLYPLLVDFGAVLSIAADAALGFAQQVRSWINAFNFAGEGAANLVSQMGEDMAQMTGLAEQATQDVSRTFWDWVTEATQWGVDLIANFATGIIDGASTVLDEAMRYIGQYLTSWLLPGSPPKILPNLDKWGIAAFEEYLKGMTKADFGVLESVQAPLKKILEGPQFANISKAIAGALAGGDRGGAMDILAKSSKVFGDDIAELARREFALADASKAVEVAELALAEAQQKTTDAQNRATAAKERAARAQQKVGAEVLKYNEMLRKGASEKDLKTQLARINATEKEASAAQREAIAAENRALAAKDAEDAAKVGVDTAKSRVDTLKEEVDWQKKFLDQLFGIQDALTVQEQKERALKGKKEKPTPEEAPMTGGFAGGIAGAIGAAIEAAKGRIKEALGGLWNIIKTDLVDKWNTALDQLGAKWEEFKTMVGIAWDALKEKYPFLEAVETWIITLPEKIALMIQTGWNAFLQAITAVYNFLNEYIFPVIRDLAMIGFELLKGKILDQMIMWKEYWLPSMQATWKFIKEKVMPIIEMGLAPLLDALKYRYIDPLVTSFEMLKKALKDAHTWFGNLLDKIRTTNLDKIQALIGHSPSPLAIGLQTAADAMERMARVSFPAMNQAMAFQPAGGSFYRPAGSTYNNTRNVNVQVGPNSVSGGLDAAALTAIVRRVLRQELQY